jgi:preprotein translocase subunit SecE
MKSTPSRPGAPARAGGNRPQTSTPQKRPAATAAQRAANAQRTQDFVRGVIAEMRRVTWPSREEWIAATLLTISLVVGVGVFTYLCDMLFGFVFGWLTGGTR